MKNVIKKASRKEIIQKIFAQYEYTSIDTITMKCIQLNADV